MAGTAEGPSLDPSTLDTTTRPLDLSEIFPGSIDGTAGGGVGPAAIPAPERARRTRETFTPEMRALATETGFRPTTISDLIRRGLTPDVIRGLGRVPTPVPEATPPGPTDPAPPETRPPAPEPTPAGGGTRPPEGTPPGDGTPPVPEGTPPVDPAEAARRAEEDARVERLFDIPAEYKEEAAMKERVSEATAVMEAARDRWVRARKNSRSIIRRLTLGIKNRLQRKDIPDVELEKARQEYEKARASLANLKAYQRTEKRVREGKLHRELTGAKKRELLDGPTGLKTRIEANRADLTAALRNKRNPERTRLVEDKVFTKNELAAIESRNLLSVDVTTPEYATGAEATLKDILKADYKLDLHEGTVRTLAAEMTKFEQADFAANEKKRFRVLRKIASEWMGDPKKRLIISAALLGVAGASAFLGPFGTPVALGAAGLRGAMLFAGTERSMTALEEKGLFGKKGIFTPDKANETYAQRKAKMYEGRLQKGISKATKDEVTMNRMMGVQFGKALKESGVDMTNPDARAQAILDALQSVGRENAADARLNRVRNIRSINKATAFVVSNAFGLVALNNELNHVVNNNPDTVTPKAEGPIPTPKPTPDVPGPVPTGTPGPETQIPPVTPPTAEQFVTHDYTANIPEKSLNGLGQDQAIENMLRGVGVLDGKAPLSADNPLLEKLVNAFEHPDQLPPEIVNDPTFQELAKKYDADKTLVVNSVHQLNPGITGDHLEGIVKAKPLSPFKPNLEQSIKLVGLLNKLTR